MLTRVTLTPDARYVDARDVDARYVDARYVDARYVDARDVDASVAAPPSFQHLAADLTLRASARHPNVHLLDAFMACIIRSFFLFHSLLRALRIVNRSANSVSAAQ